MLHFYNKTREWISFDGFYQKLLAKKKGKGFCYKPLKYLKPW